MEAIYKIFLVALAINFMIVAEVAMGDKIEVGGSQGWSDSTDYSTWASGQTFKVGDQLVFKYSSLHSVVELPSESAYKSCDITTPLNSMSGGNDVVKLDKPGTRYFACGTPGHCGSGMKVKIATVSGANGSPATPSSSSSSSSSSPSSSSSSTPASTSVASGVQYFGSLVLIITCFLGFQMMYFV